MGGEGGGVRYVLRSGWEGEGAWLDMCRGVGGRGGGVVRYVQRSGWEGRGAGLDMC